MFLQRVGRTDRSRYFALFARYLRRTFLSPTQLSQINPSDTHRICCPKDYPARMANCNFFADIPKRLFLIERFFSYQARVSHGYLRIMFSKRLLVNCRWIMVMFAFRMVMIARVGDQVYGDEQEQFVCNTNTPGCNQVTNL